ncbi:MAG: HAD-IA family hydrolase [Candidatus Micrarchaeaceae archaeon]
MLDKKLFIFDFDGTLRRSRLTSKVSRLFKQRYSVDYALKNRMKFEERRYEIVKREESKIYAFIYEYFRVFTRIEPTNGARELLEWLNAKGVKIGVFSDSRMYLVMRELREMGMSKYLDIVITSDMIDAHKPNPSGIEIILKEMGEEKRNAVYIGDMPIDVVCAKFAGVEPWALLCGLGKKEEFSGYAKPKRLFSDPLSILHLLRGRSRTNNVHHIDDIKA